jgi:hypothetical protein
MANTFRENQDPRRNFEPPAYNKTDSRHSDLSKSYHDKFNITKSQIYGSPHTTVRQIKKQMNMSVHQHLRSKASLDEMESKLEYAIRKQNHNLDRYSPIRENDDAYQMHLLS